MNATNLYVTTCRLVMQADPENRDSWTELYKLLPYLRQSLSCTVCGKLLSEPYTPTETSCQHHVCRKCLGGKKRLKPSCSWCKDYSMYVDNVQIKLVLQCYRKLCEYIKFTPIYCKLCSIYSNGGQFSLTDMIEEAIDNTINRCDETNSVRCEHESDSKERLSVPQTSGANTVVTPINTSHSVPKQPLWRHSTQASPSQQSTPTIGLGLVHVSSQPVNSTAPPVSCPPTSLSSVKAVLSTPPPPPPPPPPPVMQTTHHSPLQPVATTTTTTTTISGTSGSSFVPGTIFPSTNIVKHSVVKEVPYPKHNSSVNNGSSIYSVMYAEGDSTKITIKRKPPDIESSNKSVPIVPETNYLSQELIKKPKPKPKPKPKRKGCRCGNATPTPGKLTCCGQRCPCYVEAKACIECRCRGCRNPHRPGGKKVRPVIPQLANIQIHQVQPVHGRSTSSSITNNTTTTSSSNIIPPPTSTVITHTTLPQTIRAVQAMHAVQAVHGVSNVQAVAGGIHQLISLGGGMVQTPLSSGLGINPVASLAVKPVSLALTSVPAQLLINDDRSTSNSTSDDSDVDVDI
ncbi:E3 ubiquitin-protein ligase MSL2-like [Cherax quadricarinatus]|uniref:E3 ubiquitin-protein ligase MSL2-like n=1 Tax=Cherax quadricarinatus TaxID=27406 RepID=UPI0023783A78|nr:E3 ubiquitin-protein ligase MSL2-like [Cherax quadricarinatus]